MAGHKKTLIGNFISLSVVQGLSVIFPLITFPYLLRVLGVEGFGIFTLIQTFIIYFDLLVSFGFGLTATQYVSKNLGKTEKIQELISAVYFIKFILFILSVIVFIIVCLFIPYLRENILLVFISALYLLGNLLFPDWYFQGIQKMRNITIVTIISKTISLGLIVLLVKHPTDIVYAIFSLSAGNLIAGIVAFLILWKTFPIKRILPEKAFIVSLFKESAYVFTSIILAPLYASVNIFILQVFTNPLMVGYYAIAEKIFTALSMLTSIVNRTFYPHLSHLYAVSLAGYKKYVRTIAGLFAAGFLLIAITQFFGAEKIVRLIAGKKSEEDILNAAHILKIMSAGLIFSPFVSFFFQLLIIQGQKKRAVANIVIAVVLNLISGCLFAYFYQANGMAINLCIIVTVIAFLNFTSFNKKLNAMPGE